MDTYLTQLPLDQINNETKISTNSPFAAASPSSFSTEKQKNTKNYLQIMEIQFYFLKRNYKSHSSFHSFFNDSVNPSILWY